MLEAVDDHDLSGNTIAEMTRPRRQYKEDGRKTNKPAGRKRKHEISEAKYVNWFSPFVWNQIMIAVRRAGRPWSPRAIVKEAKKLNPKVFDRLTEQVVGRWIDPVAKAQGESQWKESVLARVAKGNTPGGQNTTVGILVSYSSRITLFVAC